jgi:hypothetical protein
MRISILIASAVVMLVPSVVRADPCCCGSYYGDGSGIVGTGQLEIGLVSRTFGNVASQGFGTMSLGGSTYSFEANGDGGMDHAQGLYGRAAIALGHFYMGSDLEILKIDPAAMTVDQSSFFGSVPAITANGGTAVGTNFMMGVGTKIDDSLFLGAELVGGMRLVEYSFTAQMDGESSSARIWAISPVLEARANAAVWLSDSVNLNAFAGKSFLDDGKVMGIALGFAERAFGA